jgi:hypothetical protein
VPLRYYRLTSIVDLVIKIYNKVPFLIGHNLEKATVLKRLFVMLNSDMTEGDYFEFGVAYGNSMRSALEAEKNSSMPAFNINLLPRNFYGFDTFSGFVSGTSEMSIPVWEGDHFNLPLKKIRKRFKRNSNVLFFQQDVNKMIDGDEIRTKFYDDLGIKHAALILFDMDVEKPTFAALTWIKPFLQVGTFLMFDEFFGFKGLETEGEAGALNKFLLVNPQITLREVCSYGLGGKVFVISNC